MAHGSRARAIGLRAGAVGLGAAALVVALTHDSGAPGRIVGSGAVRTEARTVGAFSRIELAGVGDVSVHPGSPQRVTVSAEDNIVPLVTTRVEGGTLVIGMDSHESMTAHEPISIDVRVPRAVTGSTLSGAGNLSVAGVETGSFSTLLSGAGRLAVSGEVDSLKADVEGAGSAFLDRLVARDAVVRIGGLGSAHVFVTRSLDATVTGAGSVVYAGDPPQVTTHVSGVGRVSPEAA